MANAIFKVGKTYSQSFACDSQSFAHFTISARTAKTITTEVHGKTVRRGLSIRNGVESFKPFGSHSMAMVVDANDAAAEDGAAPAETSPRLALTIRVGLKSHPVADYAEASRMTLDAVHALMRTGARMADTFTSPLIFEGVRQVAYVSQNGRVWAGLPRDWKPGATLLYDNRTEEACTVDEAGGEA